MAVTPALATTLLLHALLLNHHHSSFAHRTCLMEGADATPTPVQVLGLHQGEEDLAAQLPGLGGVGHVNS
jgi:hypothetical protein